MFFFINAPSLFLKLDGVLQSLCSSLYEDAVLDLNLWASSTMIKSKEVGSNSASFNLWKLLLGKNLTFGTLKSSRTFFQSSSMVAGAITKVLFIWPYLYKL